MGDQHGISVHKTMVKTIAVTPNDEEVPPFFEETDDVELVDYSSDSGGHWYSCQCGKEFHTAEDAYTHLQDVD